MGAGRNIPRRSNLKKMSCKTKQTLVVIVQDILLLAVLTYSIYCGHKDPDQFSGIFLRTFIPLAVSVVLCTKLLIRKLRKLAEQSEQSVPTSAA